MIELSVILCTHNPRAHYLERVILGLSRQTLAKSRFEVVVVDNASTQPLDAGQDPNVRVVREERLGLTAARLAGIAATRGELLVFCDDDNVLDPSYLETAASIARARPFVGAFGGSIVPEFEAAPPAWVAGRPWVLACRTVTRLAYASFKGIDATTPWGAGLCVRRVVAEAYREICRGDQRRLLLDRQGKSLDACGDLDLAETACRMDLAMGVFPELRLSHLIAPERLTEQYFVRWAEGNARSVTLKAALDGTLPPPSAAWRSRLGHYKRLLLASTLPPLDRRMQKAALRGRRQGQELARRLAIQP